MEISRPNATEEDAFCGLFSHVSGAYFGFRVCCRVFLGVLGELGLLLYCLLQSGGFLFLGDPPFGIVSSSLGRLKFTRLPLARNWCTCPSSLRNIRGLPAPGQRGLFKITSGAGSLLVNCCTQEPAMLKLRIPNKICFAEVLCGNSMPLP